MTICDTTLTLIFSSIHSLLYLWEAVIEILENFCNESICNEVFVMKYLY